MMEIVCVRNVAEAEKKKVAVLIQHAHLSVLYVYTETLTNSPDVAIANNGGGLRGFFCIHARGGAVEGSKGNDDMGELHNYGD